VVADLDPFTPRQLACLGIGPDIEAHDHGVRGDRQGHIGFRDSANARMQDVHLDFVGREPAERVRKCFVGTLHIGLDDD